MKDLSDRIAALTPEQRAVFEALRKKQQKKAPAGPPQPGPIPRRGPDEPLVLSFDQERLWFLHQLDPADTAYNINTSTRMTGPLHVAALKASWNEIVRRQEAWRTTFPAVLGQPAVVVAEHLELNLPLVDLSGLPAARRDALALAMAKEELRRPFDLGRGPLARATLVRVAPEDHFCLITVHHIVTDWFSFQLFWGELAALYEALRHGRPSPLPDFPVQYADFALWQRAWLQGENLQYYLDFWLKELEGAPHALELPTDRPRPANQTSHGWRSFLALPPDTAERLRALARKEGATPFMAVLAAFNALLARYSGQERVLVGSPNANRNRVEIQPLFGFFLTQLVFATDLAGDPPFRELLHRERGTALRAYQHQDLPFGKLVEALRPERDPSRAPLVQVNILLLDAEISVFELPDLTLRPVDLEQGVSRFDLTLNLWDGRDGIKGWIEYNTDLFDPTTMLRLGEAWAALVEQAVANPEVRLSELVLSSVPARHQMLAEWNDTAVRLPNLPAGFGPTVDRRFEEQAARTPDATAVVSPGLGGDLALTYAELNRRANRLAHHLRRLGVRPDGRVGLCVDRTPELAAGMLGIWKAGGAYVPLDPSYPADRLGYLVEDAGIEVVVTGSGSWADGSNGAGWRAGLREVRLDDPALAGEPEEDPAEGRPGPGDLAYVLYTSGTTGRPKGVMVEHGNLASTLEAVRRELRWGACDRVPVVAPFSFDIFLFEMWSPLLVGGLCELIPLSPALDLARLLEALEGATRVHAVPALMRQIVALVRSEGLPAPAGRCRHLRALYTGGDAVPPELLADLRETFPDAEVRILYGPTEGTILAATVVADGTERPGALLGRPLDNAYLRLRDPRFPENGAEPPVGVVGEVWIGGAGVTRGYLGKPELTAERFVETDGRRWYRTGDLARWLPDGTLEFRGRADQQVKVRGFRIEPGEVETALLELPAVREAVVLARSAGPGESGDKRLVAYMVLSEGAAGAQELRAALAGRLPDYMVPGAFVFLPEMPLTAHGKVDRKALLQLEPAGAGHAGDAGDARDSGEGGFTPPRNPAEETLAGIWRSVLNRDRVGVHDNFFRLGGDSILSIQVVARARAEGLAVTPRQLFENQTVAGLAAVALAAGTAGTAGELAEEGEVTGEAPLTPVQRYFFAQDPPEPHHFNQALLLETRQALEPGRLAAALAALARHHDALRLTFHPDGRGGWRQVYGPPDLAPATVAVDLAALPEERRSGAVEAACAGLQTGFDLARGPLLLAALFHLGGRLGEGEPGRLFLAAHHLIVDGVSWRILLEDLAAVYAGGPGRLPARTTSWKRWAERLERHAASAEERAELAFWQSLPAASVPSLPLERRQGPETVGRTSRASAALSPEVTATLLQVAPAAYRTQVNDLLLTALAQAFGRWTGVPRLLVDLEGHGREELALPASGVDLSRTVGWFTTLFPVVLDLEGVQEAGEAIKAVKEQLRSIPGRGLGFGLLRWMGAPGDAAAGRLAGLPVPQVSFNYLGQVDGALESGLFVPALEDAGPAESPRARRRHAIEIDALVLGGALRLNLSHDRRLAPAAAEGLVRGLAAALEGLAAHCAARVERGDFGGWLPSDFPLAGLTRRELDAALGDEPEAEDVEDLYPLAPLQGGMLFHSLYEPESELYFEQLSCTLEGPLDVAAFAHAWQGVVDRHPALRTDFLWEGLREPLQRVRRRARLPWTLEDWRETAAGGDLEAALDARRAADRARRFALGQAPLMRLALLRTAEAEHRLIWSFHHLLFDGWCFSLIFGEVLALYEAARAGRPAGPAGDLGLPPVRPYRDYIAWLGRQDGAAEEAWWRSRLAGFAAPTPLPGDRPGDRPAERPAERTASQAADYAEVDLLLAPAVAEGLTALAQRLEVTLNNLAQGAWALLLARLSGERDVVFGTVVSGRPPELPGVESIVGLFINTLPVRVQADPRASLPEWLQALRRGQEELAHHGWNPLHRVQGWSEVPPGEPLFESLFVFENYPIDPSLGDRLSELRIAGVAISERTNYPLTITAVSRGDFRLRAGFDPRFDAVTARRLLGHLETLLGELVRRPGATLGDLSLLTAAERHQLRVEWNDTALADPSEAPVHVRFSAVAASRPDDVALVGALVGDGPGVTYGELEAASDRLARSLLRQGVEPEERVGLLLERSAAMIEAILGVFKAGAAYVPLDPGYPAERLALMAADAGVRRVLTLERLAARVPAGCEAVPLDGPPLEVDGGAGPLPVTSGLDTLAYVMYTSGSTGRPKGVMAVHRGIVRLVHGEDYGTPWGDREVVLHVSPVAFDASTFEIWGALLRGGTVAIVAGVAGAAPSLDDIAEVIARHGVTSMFVTTGLFHLLAEERPDALAPVRRLLAGGEAMSPALARRFRDRVPFARGGPRFSNIYGPTENTTFSTYAPVDLWRGEGTVPIGRPLVNRRTRVLGRDLEPLPAGVPGELCVGGDGLARGYLGRPDLTAERFVPDSEPGRPGERLYRTGDRVRLLPDGGVEFLGRFDLQVKIRGFRIEPGEVEAVLGAHPAVRSVAVVVRSGDRGEKRLAGYVAVPAGQVDAAALRSWLEERLPPYMVPADLTVLPRLPLNAHGKVDRGALPDLAQGASEGAGREAAGGGFVAPRTAAEEILAAIWRGVLGADRVGVHDNFFHLGGDSILSIQVVARARQAGLAITPRQVFEEQTVAGLAAVAQPLGAEAEQGPVEGEAPLTPVQRFFLDDEPVEPHWFNQSVLLVEGEPGRQGQQGPQGRQVLARAVAALALHHDALRLRFAREGRAWRQFHTPAGEAAASAPLLVVDLAALPAELRSPAVEAASARLQTGFDLARGPLFLAARFEMGDGVADRLLLGAHHLVVDGVSWRVLLEDLETACDQLAAGLPVVLPAKSTSWKRWAERLAALARSGEVREEMAYWLGLAARLATPLPLDRPAGPGPSQETLSEAAAVSVSLPEAVTAALLREAPEAYRTQVNDLLLAALARAFARWIGAGGHGGRSAGLWIDLEGHGREDELVPATDLSRTVGWFTAIYPVVLDLAAAGAVEPGEAIKAVKERLRAVPRRGIGYGLLRYPPGDIEEEGAGRLAALPEPEVAFNYLGQLDRSLGAGARWSPAPEAMGPGQSPRARMRHRIEVNAWVLGGRLHATWAYGTAAFDAATIERLAAGFAAALEELVAHCTAPGAGGLTPSDFPLARLASLGTEPLDLLAERFGGPRAIEDVYPVAPLQGGMLFHSLLAPDSDLYHEQLSFVVRGPLDAAALRHAWQTVVDRHPALRTAFAWQDLPRPLQVVLRGVELPWEEEDWRGVQAAELPERWQRWRDWQAADRARRLDPGQAPLMRAALLRTGDDERRFVWSFHHLLFDGWCFALILREVFVLYEAAVAGKPVTLPPVRPYRDFLAWLDRQDPAAAERYWRGVLAGFSEANRLPFDAPGAEPAGGAEDDVTEESLALAGPVVLALGELAQRRELTLNTVVQGAWALLLSRYSGDRDVVFGTVVSGRPAELPGVETAVGLFINTLPVRVDVAPAAPLAAWLRRLQERQVEMRQHEHAPLAEVQRWSEVPAGSPLFESLLVFENYPVDESLGTSPADLELSGFFVSDRTDYPLSAAAIPSEGGRALTLRVAHDRRFEGVTVRRLLHQLEALLAGFAAAPDARLGDLPLLSEAERHQLIAEWGGTPVRESSAPVHRLIERQAARTPAAVAVAGGGGDEETLTYGELNARANRLARVLRERGVRLDSPVVLWVERSPEMVVAALAILKAGGGYVPLDPDIPDERAAWVLGDLEATTGEPPVVLADAALAKRLAGADARTVRLDAAREAAAGQPAHDLHDLDIEVSPESLAYVIYTSGSTGRPKGVGVLHGGLTAYVEAMGPIYGFTPADRVFQFASLAFDASVEEIFVTLSQGAALHLRTGPAEDAVRFFARCRNEGLTVLGMPPAYWNQLVAALEEKEDGLEVPPTLRLVILGGERVLPRLWQAWGRLAPGVRLINSYGPTETTVASTWADHPGPDRVDGGLAPGREVPIGRPVPGDLAYVLDESLRPVPAGATGELYLGGVGIARGYLARPGLTAERFLPDPFAGGIGGEGQGGGAGARLYRTGDRVRQLADGRLEFAGRLDDQVKIRGFRVEPGEIEAVIAKHPGVRQAAVIARRDPSGNVRLVAFVVPREGSLQPGDLRDFLSASLPPYMIPAEMAVSSLPVNLSGKVDRRALSRRIVDLPAPGAPAGENAAAQYVAPRNPVEERLAAIWGELLEIERVGATDDFFELGGHSLTATQLASRVRRELGVELPLARLFELRRLEDLAREVVALQLAEEEGESLETLMADLDGLSDEEALALLGEDEAGDAARERDE